jgi:hypothetical protein
MPYTYYWDNASLDHKLGKSSYSAPANIYVGLSTVNPGKDGAGLAEPSGGDYARVATAASDWESASGGISANVNPVTFPTPTGPWGTPLYATIHDAATDGNLLGYGALENVQAVGNGSTAPTFAAGDLRIQED